MFHVCKSGHPRRQGQRSLCVPLTPSAVLGPGNPQKINSRVARVLRDGRKAEAVAWPLPAPQRTLNQTGEPSSEQGCRGGHPAGLARGTGTLIPRQKLSPGALRGQRPGPPAPRSLSPGLWSQGRTPAGMWPLRGSWQRATLEVSLQKQCGQLGRRGGILPGHRGTPQRALQAPSPPRILWPLILLETQARPAFGRKPRLCRLCPVPRRGSGWLAGQGARLSGQKGLSACPAAGGQGACPCRGPLPALSKDKRRGMSAAEPGELPSKNPSAGASAAFFLHQGGRPPSPLLLPPQSLQLPSHL